MINFFLIWHGQKRVWAVWSLDSKIDSKISGMSRFNELIFYLLLHIQES